MFAHLNLSLLNYFYDMRSERIANIFLSAEYICHGLSAGRWITSQNSMENLKIVQLWPRDVCVERREAWRQITRYNNWNNGACAPDRNNFAVVINNALNNAFFARIVRAARP